MQGNTRNCTAKFPCRYESIFTWAHYRPHTIFHPNRCPLIGDWNAWERLHDRLEIISQGRMPVKTSDENGEHVLDVILYQKHDWPSTNLVTTDMYTIVLIDCQSSMSPEEVLVCRTALSTINASMVSIDCITPIEEEASDDQNNANGNISSRGIHSVGVQPSFSIVHLVSNENSRPNGMDVLSIVFDDIHNALSDYQEENIRNVMQEYGALVYNEELRRNDPPDGYYLCNSKCLQQLKEFFSSRPHTFATRDIFDVEPSSDKYILLAVEVKLSLDSLQEKLRKDEYYILRPSPHPIRNLAIVNGGEITRTWLFLINLAQTDTTNRGTRIQRDIHARAYELAMRLRESHTHLTYIPSFSSETFRQEPLTRDRLDTLCKLVKLEEQVQKYSKSIAGISGVRKCISDHVRNEKKQSCSKKMIQLIDQFMQKHPVREQRSSINVPILMQPETHNEKLFCFLEELALSLLFEMQRNVSKANRRVTLSKQLEARADKLRTVNPVCPVEVLITQTSYPNDTIGDDDTTNFGEQPI